MRKIARIAAATAVLMVVMASTAFAAAQFTDVPDGAFYSDPAAWAADNGITQGCNAAGTLFCPENNVTRGENITFAYRYDQNVVQPSLGYVVYNTAAAVNDWDGSPRDVAVTLDAPQDGYAIITHTVNAGRDHTDSPTTGEATRGRAQVLVNGSTRDSQEASWENVVTGTRDNVSWSNSIVVPVSAGENEIIGRAHAARLSYLYNQHINVLFVPGGERNGGGAAAFGSADLDLEQPLD